MKLLINSRFLTQPVTGVQRYAIECSLQIKRLLPNAIFLSPPGIINKKLAAKLGAIVIGKRSGHLWEQIDLPAYAIKQGSPPLLNLANTAPLLYTNNYITLHDLAFHFHPEWNSKGFALWYNFLIPRIIKKSKHIFTVSETVKMEINETYNIPREKITVTYNGVPVSWSGNSQVRKSKEKIILSVGTFNIRKNQAMLVKGFLKSNAAGEFKLILIGDRNKVFTDTGIDEQQLMQKGIVVASGLDEAELRNMYSKAAIVTSVSLYEGFGIPLVEGWHEQCHLLCSDIPVYRELFSQVAEFCSPTSVDDIARAIDRLAERYLNNGLENRILLPESYSFTHSAKSILAAIERNQ